MWETYIVVVITLVGKSVTAMQPQALTHTHSDAHTHTQTYMSGLILCRAMQTTSSHAYRGAGREGQGGREGKGSRSGGSVARFSCIPDL